MMSALYSGTDDRATPKILDVIMCKMRTKLRPHGITVETVWGRGYRLSRQARERMAALGAPGDAVVRETSALFSNGRISRGQLTRRLEAARRAGPELSKHQDFR
jgi:hypothetical protein